MMNSGCAPCSLHPNSYERAIAVDTFRASQHCYRFCALVCAECVKYIQLDDLHLPRIFLGFSEDGGD